MLGVVEEGMMKFCTGKKVLQLCFFIKKFDVELLKVNLLGHRTIHIVLYDSGMCGVGREQKWPDAEAGVNHVSAAATTRQHKRQDEKFLK
jgi:hypothetical protein